MFLGCGYCKAMKPNFYKAAEILSEQHVSLSKLVLGMFQKNSLFSAGVSSCLALMFSPPFCFSRVIDYYLIDLVSAEVYMHSILM